MSHFVFVIPLQRNELLNSAVGEYTVKQLSTIDQLSKEIDISLINFKNEGCAYILDHFDTLFSVVVHFTNVEWPLIHTIFDKLILGSLNQLFYFIKEQLEEVSDPDSRTRSLNILKMSLYITTQLHSVCHDRRSLESSFMMFAKVKSVKKPKKANADEYVWEWDEVQRLMLISLYRLLQLHIYKLWDPPVADEEFINMCANCCFKTLEDPTISYVKSKSLRETLFQVLGFLIKRYSYGISCVVKIVQMLRLFEHLVSPLANGVVMFVRDLGFKSLINEIVKELISSTDATNDNTGVRSFSNFLVEIAELEPSIMIPTTKELEKYLAQDPYSMRCCVLSVMTEILLNQLSHNNNDEEGRQQRDLYLDLLLEHSTDSNAFVRSKVMQLWQKIVQQNAVPKLTFLMVVDVALARVFDKSSSVCKNAIALMKTILVQNPFGTEFQFELLGTQLLHAEEDLNNLERTVGSFKNMSHENIWQSIEPEVVACLSTLLFDVDNAVEPQDKLTHLLTKGTIQENVKTIAILMTNGKYEQAFYLVRTVEEAFPGAKDIKAKMPSNNTLEYYLTIMREMFMLYKPTEGETVAEDCYSEELSVASEELKIQKALVGYLMDCLQFVAKLEEGVSHVVMILNEDSIAEVLESIYFLTSAYKFGIPNSYRGIQEMLMIVSRKEPAIKEALNDAFKSLYLEVNEEFSPQEKAVEEVNKLSKLAGSLTCGEVDSLAQLISRWIKNKELDQEFIHVLWDRVMLPSKKTEKLSSLALLSMVSQECPAMIEDKMPTLICQGLQNIDCTNEKDLYIVFFTCKSIQNIVLGKHTSKEQIRLPPDHKMFVHLMDVVKRSFTEVAGNDVFTLVAHEAIDVVMQLCITPDGLCGDLLCNLLDVIITASTDSCKTNCKLMGEVGNDIQIQCTNPEEIASTESVVMKDLKSDLIVRFIYLLGHIAFKYGEFLENYYLHNLKEKKRKEFKVISPSNDAGNILGSSKHPSKMKGKGEDEMISENDLLAAADDDATEQVRFMLDTKVFNGDGLIAGLSSLVLGVCKSNEKFYNTHLKCVAVISLAQMMMVSPTFCKQHMQLLVTMLEKSPNDTARASLIIAFGDLMFKFPNTVEPWSQYLYARLRDDSTNVRLNTLFVLSHLVTNEMIKVKGQISEVALCIVDKNEDLVDMAKKLFLDLSLKGNTLYNVLPDIISHLSNPASDITLEEKDFGIILKYIMELIQKEKHFENLVENLCKRMKESLYERQWRDLAFCLSLLPWSDRSLHKLIDHASCFCDRLLYPPVAALFNNIVSTVSRSTKPGLKEIGAELKSIIDDVLIKGSADHLLYAEDSVTELPHRRRAKLDRKIPHKTAGGRKTAMKVRKTKKRNWSDSNYDNVTESSNSD